MTAVKRVHDATEKGVKSLKQALLYSPDDDDKEPDLATHPVVRGLRRVMPAKFLSSNLVGSADDRGAQGGSGPKGRADQSDIDVSKQSC